MIRRFIMGVPVFLCLMASGMLAQEVSFVRYYGTERDFLQGIPMRATDRQGTEHLRVYYDREDRVISKGKIDARGDLVSEEIFQYDDRGNLTRRSVRDGSGTVKALYVYGDKEPMSRAFIDHVFPDRDPREFRDRVTLYRYGPGGRVLSFAFFSVDNVRWGSIEYDYFESGLVKEERWLRWPGETTVRLFQYRYDPDTRRYELTEYDSTGSRISQVAVDLGKHDREARQEVLRRRLPRLQEEKPESPDLIYLKDGDTLRVEIVSVTDTYVRFTLLGEEDVLTMPLEKVGEIEQGTGPFCIPGSTDNSAGSISLILEGSGSIFDGRWFLDR